MISKRTFIGVIFSLSAIIFIPAFAGDPIPGIDITVKQWPGETVAANALTDTFGTAIFENLAPGKYVLTLDDPSQLVGPVQIRVSQARGRRIQESAMATIQNIRRSAEKPKPVVVTLPDGSPLIVTVPSAPPSRSDARDRKNGPGDAHFNQITIRLTTAGGAGDVPSSTQPDQHDLLDIHR
ncbi:MAG: hypothetical protein CVV18_05895 [Gammaproteobacteria bacterium HGW-Gammaproteobacteria-8]|nr:MAG: hypothetical protein CVV18_05895 [Gammaproteobacteria bacterium HGW-Gammaproteobacteria-8]